MNWSERALMGERETPYKPDEHFEKLKDGFTDKERAIMDRYWPPIETPSYKKYRGFNFKKIRQKNPPPFKEEEIEPENLAEEAEPA